MNNKLSTLLKRPDIWQSSAPQVPRHTLETGHARLDKALHQGGWPTAALSEIISEQAGSGELQLLLPAVKKLCAQDRQLIFINPPHLPYAPALQQAGIPPEKVLIINPRTNADQLWSAEQILRADVATLLCWPQQSPDLSQLRKLQLAAQSNQGLSLLMRPDSTAAESSPAALRLRLAPTKRGCQVTIIKQRGGWAGQVVDINLAEALTEPAIAPAELPVHPQILTANSYRPRRSDFSRDSGGKRNAWVATEVAPTTPGTASSRLH